MRLRGEKYTLKSANIQAPSTPVLSPWGDMFEVPKKEGEDTFAAGISDGLP